MKGKQLVVITMALTSLSAPSGCGSSSEHVASSGSGQPALGGRAPAELVGTFKTTISRRDLARAPKPNELPLGPWTLVIGNRGGANGKRALGVGNGDTDRTSYSFGVTGKHLLIRCNDDQGLPSTGWQTYVWSISARRLTLRPASPACKQGDANNQLILTSHPWTKQGTR